MTSALSELNDLFKRQGLERPAGVTFLVLRSEGSYPSHSQGNTDCPARWCDIFRQEAELFGEFLRRSQGRWKNLRVNFIPAPDPASLAYEATSVLLSHLSAKYLDVSIKEIK
jgi:hypothetical protein